MRHAPCHQHHWHDVPHVPLGGTVQHTHQALADDAALIRHRGCCTSVLAGTRSRLTPLHRARNGCQRSAVHRARLRVEARSTGRAHPPVLNQQHLLGAPHHVGCHSRAGSPVCPPHMGGNTQRRHRCSCLCDHERRHRPWSRDLALARCDTHSDGHPRQGRSKAGHRQAGRPTQRRSDPMCRRIRSGVVRRATATAAEG